MANSSFSASAFSYRVFQQIHHGGRRRPEAVVQFARHFHALGLRRNARDALVNPQPEVFALDIFRRNANLLPQVQRGPTLWRDRFAFPLGHGALHHLAVHVESDRLDVAVLLAAKQVPRAAQFEIERGDAKSRAQIAEFLAAPPAAAARWA